MSCLDLNFCVTCILGYFSPHLRWLCLLFSSWWCLLKSNCSEIGDRLYFPVALVIVFRRDLPIPEFFPCTVYAVFSTSSPFRFIYLFIYSYFFFIVLLLDSAFTPSPPFLSAVRSEGLSISWAHKLGRVRVDHSQCTWVLGLSKQLQGLNSRSASTLHVVCPVSLGLIFEYLNSWMLSLALELCVWGNFTIHWVTEYVGITYSRYFLAVF